MTSITIKHNYKPFDKLSKVCLFEEDEFLNTYKNYYINYFEFLIIEENINNRKERILKSIDDIPYNHNSNYIKNILFKIVEFCDIDIFKYYISKFPINLNDELIITNILTLLFSNKNFDFILFLYNYLNIGFYDIYDLSNKISYFKSMLFDKDLVFIKYRFEEEKVIDFCKYNLEKIIELFSMNSNIIINTFLFEKILEHKDKNDLIEYCICYSIYNSNDKFYNYIIKHEEFVNNFIKNINFDWENIFVKFYKHENNSIYNQRIQSKLIYILLSKFKEYDVLDRLVRQIIKPIRYNFRGLDDDYDKSLLITLIKLPNALRSLELFIDNVSINDEINDNINYDYKNYELFVLSLFRYGYQDTINFILDKTNLIRNYKSESKEYDIINRLLCNKNLKCTKQFLENYKNNKYDYLKPLKKIKVNSYNLNFNFLSLNSEWTNIKKRINLLEKYFDIEVIRESLIHSVFLETKDIRLNEYVLKKYVSLHNVNKDYIDRYILNIFSSILKFDDIDLLKLFLSVTKNVIDKNNYCHWKLVICALQKKHWYSDYINTILEYCTPFEDLDLKSKEEIIISLCIKYTYYDEDCNEKLKNYKDYMDFLSRFVNKGVNLNKIKYFNKDLLYACSSDIIFKALIYLGVDFKPYFLRNIRNRYLFTNKNSSWTKLYILVRRLEIIRNYKNKKLHNKKYRDSVIDLLNRPPSKNKKVLEKGGILYYKNIDEFNSICLENGDNDISELENSNLINKYINPVTISREELTDLDRSIFISQKVDGINVKNIPKDSLFPKLDSKFDNVILDGEYIKELDVYLIFSTRSNTNMFDTHFEDSLELINSHPFTKKLLNLDSMMLGNHLSESKTKLLFYSEFNLLLNFCEKNKNIENKWFPKIFYKIIDPKNNLTILSLMEEYHYSIYKKLLGSRNLLTIDSGEYIKQGRIKTDGIIIYDLQDRNKIMKYKPKEFMTIDVDYYNDGRIYRCYYNYKTKEFEPLELRTDKKYPNPKSVIKQITEYHKNPFIIKDLIKEEDKLTFIRYYQKNGIKDKDTSEFMMEYKYIIGSIINRREVYYSDYILDLGCGYFNNQLWKSDKKMVGVDIDKKIHNYYKINKSKFVNKEFRLFDFREGWRISFNEKFDMCYMNMTIHYAFETKTTIRRFFRQLYKILKDNGKIFITFIDSKDLFNNSNNNIIELTDKSYIKDLGSKLEICYTFRHSEPIIEPKLDYELILKIFDNYGFELLKDYSFVSNRELKNNKWNKILKNTKYLFFQKKKY